MTGRTLTVVVALLLLVSQAGPTEPVEAGGSMSSKNLSEATYFLETWIQSVLDFDRLPGLSLAVVHDQRLVYAKGFGYANLATGIKATPDTYYSICSISKLFTSIAVMQLRDAGKLSLDDPVSKHLPWFAPEMLEPVASPPTLGDLLRHSSGLPCEPDLTVWSDPDSLRPAREDMIERISRLSMSYPTNTEFNYSNLGYALAGEVVSVVSGMQYEDYVEQNILEPLGLEATTSHLPGDLPGSQVAVGYGRWPRVGSRVEFPIFESRALNPAMGFVSTARNLAKFAMWQFRVLDGEESDVLTGATLKEMQTTQWPSPEWGYGFAVWHMDEQDFVGHQGGCPGYKSQIILCPEEKIAVVAMINAHDGPQFTVAFETYRIMAPALRTSGARTAEKVSGDWAKYTGYYTADRCWSDAEVLEWDGALSVMWVPTGNPNPLGSLVRLSHIEGGIFRQLRDDGSLGKHYVFGTNAEDHVVAMKFNNNVLRKMAR
ncbi:MAG: beta-lactamase family protein [Candidatus Eisenbacteria sp.]|nr:beta-lactamase family protein [Candidatus Eisenbacteria bacterium]